MDANRRWDDRTARILRALIANALDDSLRAGVAHWAAADRGEGADAALCESTTAMRLLDDLRSAHSAFVVYGRDPADYLRDVSERTDDPSVALALAHARQWLRGAMLTPDPAESGYTVCSQRRARWLALSENERCILYRHAWPSQRYAQGTAPPPELAIPCAACRRPRLVPCAGSQAEPRQAARPPDHDPDPSVRVAIDRIPCRCGAEQIAPRNTRTIPVRRGCYLIHSTDRCLRQDGTMITDLPAIGAPAAHRRPAAGQASSHRLGACAHCGTGNGIDCCDMTLGRTAQPGPGPDDHMGATDRPRAIH